ncbi:hypothetical protein OESDEN_02575 [Oesophagostomum dentatum]|uniref:NADP-dependent oxidoreductase domain-containing protein n=1 Tax=Oesophagostomum dentatum TaxID=61180 RepID=A0A0B1TJJ9_OESDE|nr:hypothetical protein OESDEN_02575 [Oesophagostomum dentatum]
MAYDEILLELLPKYNLQRSDIFLTTKFFPDAKDPAAAARKLVAESLERLKTSYLDMVLIHYPKASESDEKDESNPLHRKLTYIELEKLKGLSYQGEILVAELLYALIFQTKD